MKNNKQSMYIYNPVHPDKDVGRRTGIPIRKKRNVCNNVDNFDDYFTDSADEERSINVTAQMQQSALASAEVSRVQETTASSSGKNNVVKAAETCSQKSLMNNKSTLFLSEGFVDVRLINPLAVGSRFGRRTGKDILAKKGTKMLAGGMENFSDYLSDCSDISMSLHATQIQSPDTESPSTSAKESDGILSPKMHKDKSQLLKSSFNVHVEASPLFHASNISVILSNGKNEKNALVHESSRRADSTSVKMQLSNQSDHISVAEFQHANCADIETVASGCTRNEGLQTLCGGEDSVLVHSERVIALQNESEKMKFNTSASKKTIHNDSRVSEFTSEVVNSFLEKENMVPRSVSQTHIGEGVPVQKNNSGDQICYTDERSSSILKATQEEFLDNKSYQNEYIPTVCQPETDVSKCLAFNEHRKRKADCESVNHLDNKVIKNQNNMRGTSDSCKRVGEIERNNSQSNSKMNVHPLNTIEGRVTVNEPERSMECNQTSDANSQPGTSRNIVKSPTATLNFGGDVTGSVSNSERVISSQFFGIKKRLSYSSAMIESEQHNEISRQNKQMKMLSNMEKRSSYSVGSFVDHHSENSKDCPNIVSGAFVTLTSQCGSQLVTKEKHMVPLVNMNNSTDSVDEFCILEEESTKQNVSKVSEKNKKALVTKKTNKKTAGYKDIDEATKIKQPTNDEEARNIKYFLDTQMADELDEKQSGILQESRNRSERRLIEVIEDLKAPSFLDQDDNLSVNQTVAVSKASNFISLAPRRVSQLVNEVKQTKLRESLNTSTDSSDDAHLVKIVKKPKPSKTTVKRNKQIREVNKTGRQKIKNSKENEMPQTEKNIDKKANIVDMDDNCKLVNSESLDNDNKVSKHQKTKQSKNMKRKKTTAQVNIEENEVTSVHNKDVNMKHTNILQEVRETRGRLKEKYKFQEKQVEGSTDVQAVKHLKGNKSPFLELSHLGKSLDHRDDSISHLPLQRDSVQATAVILDKNSKQREVRSGRRCKQVQYPSNKPEKRHKKETTKSKRVTFIKNKNKRLKKSEIKMTGPKQNLDQMKTRDDNHFIKPNHNSLNVSSHIDNVMSGAEQESDTGDMKSNNSASSHLQTSTKYDTQVDKSTHSAISLGSWDVINGVIEPVNKNSTITSCTDNQHGLNDHNGNLSPIKELKIDCSRLDIRDFSVPVKLSTGKKRPSLSRKRKSLTTQSNKSKLVSCSADKLEESTPVKLQLISSLPKVTPQSGISFSRSRLFSSTINDFMMHSSLADSETEDLADEFSTPHRQQKHVPEGPTSCLKKRDSTHPRRKARRVRISNFIDQKQLSLDESNCSLEKTVTILPSPTSSPVHYGETTTENVFYNPESSNIVLPDLSYKIVRPNKNLPPQGVRRSARTKVMRINAHKGERIIYRRDSTGFGFLVEGIQPSLGEARVKAVEAKRRRQHLQKKSKAMKVPAKPAKRLSTHWTMNHDVTSSTQIPVVNPDNNEKVQLELISHINSVTWFGPDLGPITGAESIAMCLSLKQPMFTTGYLHMSALAEKPFQLTEHTLIYSVIYGKIQLQINDVCTIVETHADFFIPRGAMYSLKNLRREVAKLHFVDMNDKAD